MYRIKQEKTCKQVMVIYALILNANFCTEHCIHKEWTSRQVMVNYLPEAITKLLFSTFGHLYNEEQNGDIPTVHSNSQMVEIVVYRKQFIVGFTFFRKPLVQVAKHL